MSATALFPAGGCGDRGAVDHWPDPTLFPVGGCRKDSTVFSPPLAEVARSAGGGKASDVRLLPVSDTVSYMMRKSFAESVKPIIKRYGVYLEKKKRNLISKKVA